MNVAYLCDRGLEREENEDSILVDERENFYLVADGMGGHQKGSVASVMVVDAFRGTASFMNKEVAKSLGEKLVKAILEEQLNTQVEKATQMLKAYAGTHVILDVMGSTLVGIYKVPHLNKWAIFHLGDSRLYHFSATRLTQLTLDHTSVGNTSSVISKAVGNFDAMPVELNYISANKGDLFLLCSDGVSDYCHNEELLNLVLKYRSSLPLLAQYIKEFVYERGAKDNLSLVLVEVEGA